MAGKKKNIDEPVEKRTVFYPETRRAYTDFRDRMEKKGTYIHSDEKAINMLIVMGNKAHKEKIRSKNI